MFCRNKYFSCRNCSGNFLTSNLHKRLNSHPRKWRKEQAAKNGNDVSDTRTGNYESRHDSLSVRTNASGHRVLVSSYEKCQTLVSSGIIHLLPCHSPPLPIPTPRPLKKKKRKKNWEERVSSLSSLSLSLSLSLSPPLSLSLSFSLFSSSSSIIFFYLWVGKWKY